MEINCKNKKINFIQKMVEDKKAIHEHIQKNGTLKGFNNNGIKFARPF